MMYEMTRPASVCEAIMSVKNANIGTPSKFICLQYNMYSYTNKNARLFHFNIKLTGWQEGKKIRNRKPKRWADYYFT